MADTNQILEAEAAQAATHRFHSTSMQGVDQIVSVSQNAINEVLKARFDNMLKKKKDRRLRQFRHAISDYGEITTVLGAPRVQMVVPEDPESVFFFLNFTSGSFTYFTGFGPKAKKKTQDIAGWSVASKTGFGRKKLVTIPKAVADRITLLKPGSYSASQLILGFSAAAAAEIVWRKSVCPGLETNQALQFASQNMFKEYMGFYRKWLATGPFSVLGYAIHVEDRSALAHLPAPSFPPTAVRCRTPKYTPHTREFIDNSQLSASGDLDSFIFLEMTENNGFPDVPYDPARSYDRKETRGLNDRQQIRLFFQHQQWVMV